MTLLEHGGVGDPYDVQNLWFFKDAVYDYVASARWCVEVSTDTGINRGGIKKQMVRHLCAESPDLKTIDDWARNQLAAEAETVSVYKTWSLNGKNGRDNYLLYLLKPQNRCVRADKHALDASEPWAARFLAR